MEAEFQKLNAAWRGEPQKSFRSVESLGDKEFESGLCFFIGD
jgi:hypothetical protein